MTSHIIHNARLLDSCSTQCILFFSSSYFHFFFQFGWLLGNPDANLWKIFSPVAARFIWPFLKINRHFSWQLQNYTLLISCGYVGGWWFVLSCSPLCKFYCESLPHNKNNGTPVKSWWLPDFPWNLPWGPDFNMIPSWAQFHEFPQSCLWRMLLSKKEIQPEYMSLIFKTELAELTKINYSLKLKLFKEICIFVPIEKVSQKVE